MTQALSTWYDADSSKTQASQSNLVYLSSMRHVGEPDSDAEPVASGKKPNTVRICHVCVLWNTYQSGQSDCDLLCMYKIGAGLLETDGLLQRPRIRDIHAR